MLGFHFVALFSCLQHSNKFFKPGLEAQKWKRSDYRAFAYFLTHAGKAIFFFFIEYISGSQVSSNPDKCFLITSTLIFRGNSGFVKRDILHDCEVSLVFLSQNNHFAFCCWWCLADSSVFTFSTVRLALVFHLP